MQSRRLAFELVFLERIEVYFKFQLKFTFSTTDVNLKVKYNPVVREEKRLPYSLFRKNLYQTGAGNNARYSNSMYSTNVSI